MTMNMNIKGLEDFKLVMATITQVQQLTITAEVKFRNMQEIFHMLRQHGIDVSLIFDLHILITLFYFINFFRVQRIISLLMVRIF